MLAYDVLLLTLHGMLIAQGTYHVPPGELVWTLPPPPFCNFCNDLVNLMLNPPQKFLEFRGGKYIGPGALGFPTGIMPCNKYLVEGRLGNLDVKYVVCAYKNVIVYEYYLGSLGAQVSLRPTLEALKYVSFITDPASPTAKTFLMFLAAVITGLSLVAFLRRHEIVVV